MNTNGTSIGTGASCRGRFAVPAGCAAVCDLSVQACPGADIAYATLLRGQRQALHSRIAESLEKQFHDVVELEPEILAQHYSAGGLIEQAVPYWLKAVVAPLTDRQIRRRSATFRRGLNTSARLRRTLTEFDRSSRFRPCLDQHC